MDGSLAPVDGSNMPVDAAGASSDNATGGGVRMFASSANAQYNHALILGRNLEPEWRLAVPGSRSNVCCEQLGWLSTALLQRFKAPSLNRGLT